MMFPDEPRIRYCPFCGSDNVQNSALYMGDPALSTICNNCHRISRMCEINVRQPTPGR